MYPVSNPICEFTLLMRGHGQINISKTDLFGGVVNALWHIKKSHIAPVYHYQP